LHIFREELLKFNDEMTNLNSP